MQPLPLTRVPKCSPLDVQLFVRHSADRMGAMSEAQLAARMLAASGCDTVEEAQRILCKPARERKMRLPLSLEELQLSALHCVPIADVLAVRELVKRLVVPLGRPCPLRSSGPHVVCAVTSLCSVCCQKVPVAPSPGVSCIALMRRVRLEMRQEWVQASLTYEEEDKDEDAVCRAENALKQLEASPLWATVHACMIEHVGMPMSCYGEAAWGHVRLARM